MNEWKPVREWEEPEEYSLAIKKGINHYLSIDIEQLDVNEVLEFIRDMKMELAIYYARIEALQKLEKKAKEAIRYSGEIPDVEGVIVKFGKPFSRTMVHTKMLVESAKKDPVPGAREKMVGLHDHIHDTEGRALLEEIQVALSKHIPLEKFLYDRDISPSIKIEV